MGKVIGAIVVALLVTLQAIVGIPSLMTDGGYWQRALLYSFFHANWWHLAVNAIAVWTICSRVQRTQLVAFLKMLLVAFLIAVLVYPLSFRPVIGFSNVLYAVLGLRTPRLHSPWWRQPSVAVFIIITLTMAFIPRFSATTHIAAFLLGMAGAAVHRLIIDIDKDARRYY